MMSHPLIGDLSDKSTEVLEETISTLGKRMHFASRTNNQAMMNQLLMVLNAYRSEFQRRQDEIWNKKSQDYNSKIDIS